MFNLKPSFESGITEEDLLRGCQRAVRLYDGLMADLQAKPVPDPAVNYVLSAQRQQVVEFMFKLDSELNSKNKKSGKKEQVKAAR